jgi:MFS family permease
MGSTDCPQTRLASTDDKTSGSHTQARHDTALVAGLLMVPQGVGSLLPRTLAGKLTDKIGPRLVVLAGVALAAAGTIPFALAGLHTSYWLLGAALVVRGAGLGTATIAVMAGAFHGLSPAQVPHASSATRIVQFVGGSFGAAVLVAVILDRQAAAHAAAGAAAWPPRTPTRSGGALVSPPWPSSPPCC